MNIQMNEKRYPPRIAEKNRSIRSRKQLELKGRMLLNDSLNSAFVQRESFFGENLDGIDSQLNSRRYIAVSTDHIAGSINAGITGCRYQKRMCACDIRRI
jgi:hypothetical protein